MTEDVNAHEIVNNVNSGEVPTYSAERGKATVRLFDMLARICKEHGIFVHHDADLFSVDENTKFPDVSKFQVAVYFPPKSAGDFESYRMRFYKSKGNE